MGGIWPVGPTTTSLKYGAPTLAAPGSVLPCQHWSTKQLLKYAIFHQVHPVISAIAGYGMVPGKDQCTSNWWGELRQDHQHMECVVWRT